MRVAITTLPGRLAGLDALLRAAGLTPLRMPLLSLRPRRDTRALAAARELLGLPWRVYPSRGALEAWLAIGLGFETGLLVAALGKATALALRAAGAEVAAVGEPAHAAGLLAALLAHPAAPRPGGQAVGLVQGGQARSELGDGLLAAGIEVRTAEVYDVAPSPWTLEEPVAAVLLGSPSAVAALPPRVAEGARLVAIGPTTAAAVSEQGWPVWQAAEPSPRGVFDALWLALGRPVDGAVRRPDGGRP